MEQIKRLFENNRQIVKEVTSTDPDFFRRRAGKQEPHFLFIGCADSRVPVETLTGVGPGEMFVHRNIANQVMTADFNLLSVLQYAVEVLDVEHVIVCGHYQCGGVKAAMGDQSYGLVDHWLQGVRNIVRRNTDGLSEIHDEQQRFNRVVELNVVRQIYNLSQSPVVKNAWKRGRRPLLHGIVYDIHDGLLKEVVMEVDREEKVRELFESGVRAISD